MKQLDNAKNWFKSIKSIRQALLRTLFIFISMPAAAIAGMQIDKNIEIDNGFVVKSIALLIASLCGGISSTFVKTTFDSGMSNPSIAKVFIGTCLGTFSGMAALDNSSFGIFSIALPTFFVASLGAPLMVFYLMWLSDPETQAEIKETITEKVRLKRGIEK